MLNEDKFNRSVDFQRIGADCFYDAISCMLNGEDKLIYALSYVDYCFYYNRNNMTRFSLNKDPESYLSENNRLFFNENPYLKYSEDFLYEVRRKFERSILYEYMGEREGTPSNVLREIKKNKLEKGIIVSILVDTFYLKEEYIKNGGKYDKGHNGHYITLFDINFNTNTCYIIDKHYNVKGSVSLQSIIMAMQNDFVKKNHYIYFDVLPRLSTNEIQLLFKKNLLYNLEKQQRIHDDIYYKNVYALEMFINDFEDIIDELYAKYKKYTPQHLSFSLIKFRAQRGSQKLIFEKLGEYLKYPEINELIDLTQKSYLLWQSYDLVLDKIFLKEQSILNEKGRLKKILNEILFVDQKVIENMKNLYFRI